MPRRASTPAPIVEGRLDEEKLDNFRFEVGGNGLSSYPHPRLMPDLWEFPTVSMGLGPISAIYQARFNRYLLNREHRRHERIPGLVLCRRRRVRRAREPRLRSASRRASGSTTSIFVVNCNLQRLDGPVRGNGKIIQELEAVVPGLRLERDQGHLGERAGTSCLARDVDGVLVNKMNTTLDGDFQNYATESGAYIREHFFGPDPRLQASSSSTSPTTNSQTLPRGGHDYRKLYAAYKAATEHGRGADGHPRQDGQGLDARARDRGPQRHPPDQEDDERTAAGASRPAQPAGRDPRRGSRRRRAALLPTAGGLAE